PADTPPDSRHSHDTATRRNQPLHAIAEYLRTVIVWLLHRDCLFIGVALNRVRRTWTVHWFPGPMWLLWYVDRR
ncbi:hypothetical protein ThrDRAFT_04017, partial [Frankia casuarinae]